MKHSLEIIKESVAADRRRIVLPESEDPRTLQAAATAASEGYADVVLIGEPEEIKALAEKENVSLEGVTLWDPKDNADADSWIDVLYEKRKHKGMTRDQASELMKDRMYIGAMMVHQGSADGIDR